MKKIPGVEIRKIEPAAKDDPRGMTYEWCKGDPGLQVTILERKKGCSFGNHYHTGIDPAKNPEKIFLIQGKLRFQVYDRRTRQEMTEIITAGQELRIFPEVEHSFTALANSILLEYRCTVFKREQPDTHPNIHLGSGSNKNGGR